MNRPVLTIIVLLLLTGVVLYCLGCRQYDHYAIRLRDAQTGAPVPDAKLVTRYDFFDELMVRPFHWGALKNHEATTNSSGYAYTKVESNRSWWFAIEAPGRPLHSIHFNPDGTLNHSLGRLEVHEGWADARQFMGDEPGSLQALITPIAERR